MIGKRRGGILGGMLTWPRSTGEVATMSTEDFEIRLWATRDPDGQISLTELAALATRLQELATRVGRWVADIDGPGRSPAGIDEIAQFRLSGIAVGSTRLVVTRGLPGTLDVEESVEHDLSLRFWDVIAGISTDTPPDDAPVGVRESAAGLLDALGRTSGGVRITRLRDHARAEFRPTERNRAVWVPTPDGASAEDKVVTGKLEMVDLHSGTFRVRDDVGNAITLYRVREPETAIRLVGTRTTATGTRDRARRGAALDDVTLSPAESLPASWTGGMHDESWRARLADAGPDPAGGIDLDDDEWEAFVVALRGQ